MTPTVDLPPHIAAALAGFRGASVVSIREHGEPEPPLQGIDENNELHERIFEHVGPALLRRGWSVYPQTRKDGNRRPAVVDGRSIKPKELGLSERLPTAEDVRWWAICAPMENVAAVMGRGSGMFGLDIDVSDWTLADRIVSLALQDLGPAFVRQAGEARATLYYQRDPSDPVDLSRFMPLLDAEGRETGHVIEVLTNGKASTLYGRHHRNGLHFKYAGLQPLRDDKSVVAMVGKSALQAFLDRVDSEICRLKSLREYDRKLPFLATGAVEGTSVDAAGLVRPGAVTAVRDVTTNAAGKITDGREAWLRDRAVAWCRHNWTLAESDAGRRILAARLAEEAAANWDGLGRYRSQGEVLGAALERIVSGKRFVEANPHLLKRVGREENGRPMLAQRVAVKVQRNETVGGLDWLSDDLLGKISLTSLTVADRERKAAERAIVTDAAARRADWERVTSGVRATIDRLIDQAYAKAARYDDEPVRPIGVLKAPTGAGKTSTAIERISDAKRRRGPIGKPILVLMPSYNNIEESVLRAKGKRRAPVPEVTAAFKAGAAAAQADAETLGLDVGILTGRERGGCLMTEHLKLLRAAKVNASGLCSAEDEDAIERADRLKANRARKSGRAAGGDPGPRQSAPKAYCNHHPNVGGSCPLILARHALLDRDIVFAPMSFITNNFPGELKDAFAAVIIDERCVFELLHYTTMPVSTLERERAAPPVLQKDGSDVTGEDFLADRARIAKVVVEALSRGEDAANAIMAHRDVETLRGLVKSAITVTGRGQRTAMEVKPNMNLAALVRLTSTPQAVDLKEEARFWHLLDDRLEALVADRVTRDLAGGSPDPALLKAKGDRDHRMQVMAEGMVEKGSPVSVRMSWRAEPNLATLPLLLLDASADVDMIRKVWSGREVVPTVIEAYIHMRTVALLDGTYSTTSLDPSGVKDEKVAARIDDRVVKVRRAENVVAHVFGQGRVLTVAPKRVRRAVRLAYCEAPNIDTGHYGAMRGLDFAKAHKAVLTIGRHEFPTWVVDALAAALTYDDDVPEAPCDVDGNGLDPATGEPRGSHQVERTYMLRDGRDLKMKVPEMPGRWGRAVQRQFREEEQLQAAGRLRPVYREGEPPVWVAMSKILPENVIIDAVTTLDELSDPRGAGLVLDAIRRVGVIDVDLLNDQAGDLRTVRGIQGQLRHLGLDTPGQQTPYGAGIDTYGIRIGDEAEMRMVGVPAYHPDPVSAVVEAYDRSGKSVKAVRLVAKGSDPEPSQVKAPDKVDAEIGGRDERAEAETEARNAIIAAKREALLADPWNRLYEGGPLLTEPGRQDVAAAVVRATQGSVIPEEPASASDDEPRSAPDASPASPAPRPIVPVLRPVRPGTGHRAHAGQAPASPPPSASDPAAADAAHGGADAPDAASCSPAASPAVQVSAFVRRLGLHA